MMLRHITIWLAVATVIGLAAWFRMDWIESATVTQRCLEKANTLGCLARTWAIVAFTSGGLTIAAITSAALALAWQHPLSAVLAMVCGGIGMMLYRDEPGAVALLVGALRLARLQVVASGRHTPGQEHR